MYLTAAPFWLEKPTNLVLAPEQNGRLVCRSDGVPRPTINWFYNGDPIECKCQNLKRHIISAAAVFVLFYVFFFVCSCDACAAEPTGVRRHAQSTQCHS